MPQPKRHVKWKGWVLIIQRFFRGRLDNDVIGLTGLANTISHRWHFNLHRKRVNLMCGKDWGAEGEPWTLEHRTIFICCKSMHETKMTINFTQVASSRLTPRGNLGISWLVFFGESSIKSITSPWAVKFHKHITDTFSLCYVSIVKISIQNIEIIV